jgi:hypothetical protein
MTRFVMPTRLRADALVLRDESLVQVVRGFVAVASLDDLLG